MPRIRLRARLMLGTSIVLLPLLGLLLFGLVENTQMRRDSILNSLRQTANTSGLLVDTSLMEARQMAQTIAATAATGGLEPGALRALIEHFVRQRSDLLNVAVFDAAGRPLASVNPWPGGVPITDRAYFQETLQTRAPVISELLIGRRVKQPWPAPATRC